MDQRWYVGVPHADGVVECGSEQQDQGLVECHAHNRTGMLFVFVLLCHRDRVPQDQFALVVARRQELQFRDHYHRRYHRMVSILQIIQLFLGVRFYHPQVYLLVLCRAVEDIIDLVPSHGIYFDRKLMHHFLLLVLWLFGQSGCSAMHIPPSYYAVRTTGNQHIVFLTAYINHVKECNSVP